MLQYKAPVSTEPKKVNKEAEVIRQSLDFMRSLSNDYAGGSQQQGKSNPNSAGKSKQRPKTAHLKSGLTR